MTNDRPTLVGSTSQECRTSARRGGEAAPGGKRMNQPTPPPGGVREQMTARDVIARYAIEADLISEWDDEESRGPYLQDADAIIDALSQAGFTIVQETEFLSLTTQLDTARGLLVEISTWSFPAIDQDSDPAVRETAAFGRRIFEFLHSQNQSKEAAHG